jgi:hypothetical protein
MRAKLECQHIKSARKRTRKESVFDVSTPKPTKLKLSKDSTAMGFAVFLHEEFAGIGAAERSDVFLSALFVHLVQLLMIWCVWEYAATNEKFAISAAESLDMIIARFVASMMMHINCEKDVRNGINMMKYCINHRANFTNPYAAFLIAFASTVIGFITEVNVMIILSSMPNILGVVMKYVSLAAISKIPGFYYASLVEHKLLAAGAKEIKVTKYRHDNPMEGASICMYFLRFVYKFIRMFYCGFSFYFMPFMTIMLNF